MPKPILFNDQFALKSIPFFKDAQDYANDVMKSKKAALRVECDATYSGYLLNGRVYPAKYMKAAAPTWVSTARGGLSPFDKPVLLNHNAEDAKDALGRVVSAQYHALWQGDKLTDDWRNPQMGYTKGSGYTRLGLNIVDQDAIERFLDGRYSTFSTSFTSPNLICSICGCDWMQKFPDLCEHTPGKTYVSEDDQKEAVLCYLITGPMDWREVSVVNTPAQPFAVADLMKLLANGQDSATFAPAGAASHQDFDASRCEVTLFDAEGNAIRLTRKTGETDAISTNGKLRPSTKVSIPDVVPSSPGDCATTTGTASKSEDGMEEGAFALAHVAKSLLDAGLLGTDDELNKVYGTTLPVEPSYDECVTAARGLEDVQLSAKQRETLKTSTYCGPGRSFPVPDCAHVTAAKKLIGRYKGSASEKERILDSVNRKASELGCSSGESEQKQTNASENPNMPDPVTPTPATPPAAPAAPVAPVPGNDKGLAALADQIAELRKTQQSLQADRDSKETDLKASRDTVASLTQELHDARVAHLVALRAVTVRTDGDKPLDSAKALQEYADSLKSRPSASIKDSLADESKVFAAKLPHLKGLPAFISDAAQPATPVATRVVAEPVPGTSTPKPKETLDY